MHCLSSLVEARSFSSQNRPTHIGLISQQAMLSLSHNPLGPKFNTEELVFNCAIRRILCLFLFGARFPFFGEKVLQGLHTEVSRFQRALVHWKHAARGRGRLEMINLLMSFFSVGPVPCAGPK
jgi:hypothetical protein